MATAPTSFTVGPPVPEDGARWRELYRGYADFYQESVTDEQLDLVWSWISDPDHDVKALLVRDATGAAVGLAHLASQTAILLRGKHPGCDRRRCWPGALPSVFPAPGR
ncbi:MAG: hypothetical protein ACYDC9_02960 [Dermatophilaceae bacterium]